MLVWLLFVLHFLPHPSSAWTHIPNQRRPRSSRHFLVSATSRFTTKRQQNIKTLCIDYGLTKTGLAIGSGLSPPQPLPILRPATIPSLLHTMQTYQIQQVVLGWPLHKNGTMAEQTWLTREFGLQCKVAMVQTLGPHVPLFVWDERYTSRAARAQLDARNERVDDVDAEAACIILDSFFRDKSGGDLQTLELEDEEQLRCVQVYLEKCRAMEEERQREIELRVERMERKKQAKLDQIQMESQADTSPSGKKKKKKRKRR